MRPLWRELMQVLITIYELLRSQGCRSKNIIGLTHAMEISYIIKLIVNKMKMCLNDQTLSSDT